MRPYNSALLLQVQILCICIQFFGNTKLPRSYGSITFDSVKVFVIVALLVFPSTLGIMGVGYAQMSIAPFSFIDASDQLYQRLLMPAIAYALHLRGPVLYHLFSLAISFCMIFLLHIFFLRNHVFLTTLEYASIAVSGFIITQFQSCLLYTSPSPRDRQKSRMPSSA